MMSPLQSAIVSGSQQQQAQQQPQQRGTGTPGGKPLPPRPSNLSRTNVPTTSTPSIYDKNLVKNSNDINMSALSFLFCEIVSWAHRSSKGIHELEKKLNHLGYSIGAKYLELIKYRENYLNSLNNSKQYGTGRREIKILEILQFIHSKVWKSLFGNVADNLEKSSDNDQEYMITDNVPLFSRFISVPRDFKDLNCSAFVAGIIEGILDSAYFQADVSAHTVAATGLPTRTVFLIKFDQAILKREKLRYSK